MLFCSLPGGRENQGRLRARQYVNKLSKRMSYAKELIKKYVKQGQIILPEGMTLEDGNLEEDEHFGVKEFIFAVLIAAGFIFFTLLYFGNPETIAFVRQILR